MVAAPTAHTMHLLVVLLDSAPEASPQLSIHPLSATGTVEVPTVDKGPLGQSA